MKLKFYMRGLGIGILVTAVLMSVTINGKTEKLTDEEIIERAKTLGMEEKYDSAVLSAGAADLMDASNVPDSSETSETPELSDVPDTSDLSENSDEVSGNEIGESDNESPEQPWTSEADKESEGESKPENTVLTIQVTVQGGDGSMSISRKLQEAGVIEDALAYDKFLCQNGYDRRICTGTHSIPVGATEEEIARILTNKVR